MVTFGYTILYVEDVRHTLDFYIQAFGVTQKFITPDNDYGELDTGSTTLAFAAYSVADYNGVQITKSEVAAPAPAFELAFVTEDIAATFAHAVQAGAVVVKEPAEKPWGQMVGYVRDINGFLVEICTPTSTP